MKARLVFSGLFSGSMEVCGGISRIKQRGLVRNESAPDDLDDIRDIILYMLNTTCMEVAGCLLNS
ncbi:MAG: hypothetical protein JJE29_08650 [Peptostreptococcaceae bacterium]|nr:hypothetical protein [Peptostreptococcaceae bacterium]